MSTNRYTQTALHLIDRSKERIHASSATTELCLADLQLGSRLADLHLIGSQQLALTQPGTVRAVDLVARSAKLSSRLSPVQDALLYGESVLGGSVNQ